MIVSGKFYGEINSDRRCVYIVGNLKSDKKLYTRSSKYCSASSQSLSMKFEKISDDVDLNLVNEKKLKEFDG